jgi:hypothetical protein
MITLLIILAGLIGWAIFFFAQEIPKGREQRRRRAVRAAQASKGIIGHTEQAHPLVSLSKSGPKLIHCSSERSRSASRNAHPVRTKRGMTGSLSAIKEHGESYEMHDLENGSGGQRQQQNLTGNVGPRQNKTLKRVFGRV